MVGLSDVRESTAGGPAFNAIKISIASPEQILNWSHGEVTKPETCLLYTSPSPRDRG